MTLELGDLQAWLSAELVTAGYTAPVQINRLPDDPDEVVVVQQGTGTALLVDGAFEGTAVHVRSRGTSDEEAEALAKAVHAVLVSAAQSFAMGTTYVLYVEPSHGPPAYLDRDVSNRSVYAGEYEFVVAV